jgi:hypothetical protein
VADVLVFPSRTSIFTTTSTTLSIAPSPYPVTLDVCPQESQFLRPKTGLSLWCKMAQTDQERQDSLIITASVFTSIACTIPLPSPRWPAFHDLERPSRSSICGKAWTNETPTGCSHCRRCSNICPRFFITESRMGRLHNPRGYGSCFRIQITRLGIRQYPVADTKISFLAAAILLSCSWAKRMGLDIR